MGGKHSSSRLLNRFDDEQMVSLQKLFQDLSSRKNSSHLDRDTFLRVFKLPGMLGERLFDVFDSNKDSRISSSEFLEGLSVIVHGSFAEKVRFLFEMYDLNSDGLVSHAELSTMLNCAANGDHFFNYEKLCDSIAEESENKSCVDFLLADAFPGEKSQALGPDEFKAFIARNSQILEILEDTFVFEDLSDSEKSSAESESKEGQRKFSRSRCFFGNIVTPLSVKQRRRDHQPTVRSGAGKSYHCPVCRFDFPVKKCFFCFARVHKKYCQECKKKCTLFFCPICGYKLKSGSTSELPSINKSRIEEYISERNSRKNDLSHAYENIHHLHHQANLQGKLFKVGRSLRLPIHRYLVLHDSVLYIFRKKTDTIPFKTVWMEGCVISRVNSSAFNKKNLYGVEISFPGNPTDAYHKRFFSHSDSVREKWLSALVEATDSKDIYSHYSIGKCIGEGKFSKVHMCYHKKTGKKYAAKIIDRTLMTSREKESLRKEISIMKLLHHPNIVHIHSVHETTEKIFLVLQYVEGGDLFDRVKERGTFSEEMARKVMWSLFDVCKYIHKLGVVHRDLKLENVMMCSEERDDLVAVGDFGLSTFLAPGAMATTPCGTLAYVAPEVFEGSGYGREVDLWCLGMIMYVLLRGNLPFANRRAGEGMGGGRMPKLEFDGPRWSNISTEAKDLISNLLAVNPMKRIRVDQALKHPWFSIKLDSATAVTEI